jgi:hypothetical protein
MAAAQVFLAISGPPEITRSVLLRGRAARLPEMTGELRASTLVGALRMRAANPAGASVRLAGPEGAEGMAAVGRRARSAGGAWAPGTMGDRCLVARSRRREGRERLGPVAEVPAPGSRGGAVGQNHRRIIWPS